jgi:hypothetical protein
MSKDFLKKAFYIVIETKDNPDENGYLGYIVARTNDYSEAIRLYEENTKDRGVQKWENEQGQWIR